ncbi:MAG TPA: response regulator [Candidatus Binatia bacterium]|nr:response regulator [Candidatus Binatia bacterium]
MGGSGPGPILIVEDTEDHRDFLGVALRAAGYRVAYATDGQDAFNRLESGLRPSLIILDVAMPRMDGFEFRERQLADARFRDIPVIIVTAVKSETEVQRIFGVPGIQKPYLLDAVIDAVRTRVGNPA